ncbi:MAG TPA: hypothetical protein VFP10_07900, partial [Candidatus Eisenbacteria bacterium]|nr:hypothetical protein [Candidatus Eisenbacteria bacterium]
MKRLPIYVLLLFLWADAWARPLPISENATAGISPTPSSSAGVLGTNFAIGETIFFGGTHWAPDSMRWEAVKDSVWTFDTGVGSFLKEPG